MAHDTTYHGARNSGTSKVAIKLGGGAFVNALAVGKEHTSPQHGKQLLRWLVNGANDDSIRGRQERKRAHDIFCEYKHQN